MPPHSTIALLPRRSFAPEAPSVAVSWLCCPSQLPAPSPSFWGLGEENSSEDEESSSGVEESSEEESSTLGAGEESSEDDDVDGSS